MALLQGPVQERVHGNEEVPKKEPQEPHASTGVRESTYDEVATSAHGM
jgi:hypothetical protein